MGFNDNFIHDIIDQAKHFLEELFEFFPFGFKLNSNNSTQPVFVYFEDEATTAKTVIEELKVALKQELAQNDCKAVGLCMNVKVTNEQISSSPFDAIQVCIQNKDGESADVFIVYTGSDGLYEYVDAYEYIGSLNVL